MARTISIHSLPIAVVLVMICFATAVGLVTRG